MFSGSLQQRIPEPFFPYFLKKWLEVDATLLGIRKNEYYSTYIAT